MIGTAVSLSRSCRLFLRNCTERLVPYRDTPAFHLPFHRLFIPSIISLSLSLLQPDAIKFLGKLKMNSENGNPDRVTGAER